MEMTIDIAIYFLEAECLCISKNCKHYIANKKAIDTMRKYQLMQADYNARLKADLEAILAELQLEINEIPINKDNSEPFRLGQASAYDKCENLIQVKIDQLKGVEE